MMVFVEDEDELWSDKGLFCPFCKEEQSDIFEIAGAYIDGEHDTSCGSCGSEFEFSVCVSHSWTSLKPPKEGE